MAQGPERVNNFPNIGDICRLKYKRFNVDAYAVCTELRYLPGDKDRPTVRVVLKQVRPKDEVTS